MKHFSIINVWLTGRRRSQLEGIWILLREIQSAIVVKKSQRGFKTICVPMFDEQEYQVIVENQQLFRQYLDEMREKHPEIFPSGMEKGYSLYGLIKSSKLGLRIRRIQLKATKQIYQVRPSFVMPYMIGKTEELEKPLYLRRFGVPYEALAYVFGQDPMYWYRATAARLSFFSHWNNRKRASGNT